MDHLQPFDARQSHIEKYSAPLNRLETSLIPYAGWKRCLRIASGDVEAVVTLEVGPRIIRFGRPGGRNMFAEYPDQVGTNGGERYRSYGGHRLWAAPETDGWTNHPDNGPVETERTPEDVTFTAAREARTGLRKRISVSPARHPSGLIVKHRITNEGVASVRLAPWALSVMAPGGTAIIPQEQFIQHGRKLLPARPTVLWNYTDMTDPRWSWGKSIVQLRQSSVSTMPQKFGVLTSDGWAAYANDGVLFVKSFAFIADAEYPDFGCNAEFFTNARMLEVETLGPLTTLEPGASCDHREAWHLFDVPPLSAHEADVLATIQRCLSTIPAVDRPASGANS